MERRYHITHLQLRQILVSFVAREIGFEYPLTAHLEFHVSTLSITVVLNSKVDNVVPFKKKAP